MICVFSLPFCKSGGNTWERREQPRETWFSRVTTAPERVGTVVTARRVLRRAVLALVAVLPVLIREGLARPYDGRGRRGGWC
jgi:hypothetical protein